MINIWAYSAQSGRDTQAAIIGYNVKATDGNIGEVTEESVNVDDGHIVVDTGFWIMEKKRLIPAGAVSSIDYESQTVRLALSKSEVKHAPDYVVESTISNDAAYRERLAAYYHPWIGT